MSTLAKDGLVEEIKSRCNIVEVIGRVVALKKAGSNYKGICPFHNEKTPSFVVSETKQIFTCFGCGATGDVIAFVERYYQLDFLQAIEKLADEYGIDISRGLGRSEDKEISYTINREAAKFFYKAMRTADNPAYAYVKKRGLSDDTLNEFGIGYADEKWDSLYTYLIKKGYKKEKLLELGLISNSKGKYFDKFRGRVIFPIINTNGKVIGFGGRVLDDGIPKYLNSPETSVFSKKNNLYGLNLTRKDIGKKNQIILVEGYMDVISLYQNGVRNVSASLGTALTESQGKLIKRYTENVILCYDSDEAGISAALRGLDILYEIGCRVKVMHVDEGKDPDEFIKKRGKLSFLELTEKALGFADYKFDLLKQKYDLDVVDDRISFMKDAVKVIKQLSPVEADVNIKKLAADTKISESAIRLEINGNNRQRQDIPVHFRDKEPPDVKDISMLEKSVIKLILTDSGYYARFEPYKSGLKSLEAMNIYKYIGEQMEHGEELDIKRLEDVLDEEDRIILKDIIENIQLWGEDEAVFKDCVAKIEDEDLKKREQDLILRLSMADEEENQDVIKNITDELMKVQTKIAESRG